MRSKIFSLQGITLSIQAVALGMTFTMPASCAVFLTSAHGLNLSRAEYGNSFLLMIAGTLFSSYFGGIAAKKKGVASIIFFGAILSFLSMFLLSLEALFITYKEVAYPLLILIMFLFGLGYGALILSLSSAALHIFGDHFDTATTSLYALSSLGAGLSPLLFTSFSIFGIWWAAPLIVCTILISVALLSYKAFKAPLHISFTRGQSYIKLLKDKKITAFCLIALSYGICETLFSVWGAIFLNQEKNLPATTSAIGLTLFWMGILIGRVVNTFLTMKFSAKKIFPFLAMILCGSFLLFALNHSPFMLLLSLSLAGIGCSALFPFMFSLSQKLYPSSAPSIGGLMSAFYIIGYGIASSGLVTVERKIGTPLPTFYIIGSAFALMIAVVEKRATNGSNR
jgi:MFS family permease